VNTQLCCAYATSAHQPGPRGLVWSVWLRVGPIRPPARPQAAGVGCCFLSCVLDFLFSLGMMSLVLFQSGFLLCHLILIYSLSLECTVPLSSIDYSFVIHSLPLSLLSGISTPTETEMPTRFYPQCLYLIVETVDSISVIKY